MFVNREYLSDQGSDGAGWGPADSPSSGPGLPTYTGTLADGTKLSAEEVVTRFGRPMRRTKQPVTAEQWEMIVHAKDNDPTLEPATTPARKTQVGEVLEHQVFHPWCVQDAGGTREDSVRYSHGWRRRSETQYMRLFLSRKFGPVYVMHGKMPTFPNTYAGTGGKGLEIMPAARLSTGHW